MISHSAQTNMIKQQLRTGDVLNQTVLDLFTVLPRQDFVPQNRAEFAYSDMQIPLAHGQQMLTPTEEGTILQALNLQGHETVLEIGTGSGYLTALLSRMAAKVISIDYFSDFTQQAQQKLINHNCHNVELITGDASRGWFDEAPYDAVVITGAIDGITESHRLQVLPGGKLIAMVGNSPVVQTFLLSLDHEGNWKEQLLFETNTPSLIDKLKPQEFVF